MSKKGFFVAGIGASAGGLQALREFFIHVNTELPVAFVVVTHLFRDHRSELSNIISRFTKMPVERVAGPMPVEAGKIYVMPEDVVLEIHDSYLHVIPRLSGEVINRAIDIFFTSLAADQKQNAIGIILSGMGSDGTKGAQAIYKYGGEVLVQEPDSTPFNSMPCATIMHDHPDAVLPPKQLAQKLESIVISKRVKLAS
jgi:two-component system, chemotaxis family, protein-glutamate methylesterase/glutaminase